LLRWLADDVPHLRSARATESHARALVPHVGARRLDEVGEVWAEYLAANRGTLTPSTLNRRGAILRRVARLAYREWGWLDRPVHERIRMLPENPARHLYLTQAELHRLVTACAHPQARAAILLAAYTGLRLGELMRLQPEDIEGDVLVVHTSKNGRPRRVPVHRLARPALDALPITVGWRWVLRHFERARDALGRPDLRFHDLRHTAASWLIQAGADLTTVRDLLGHRTVTTTSRYAHLAVEHLRAAVDAVGRAPPVHPKKKATRGKVA
jgi:integrase